MKIINISRLSCKTPLNLIKEEFEKLYESNLQQIKKLNKLYFTFPLNLQSLLCLMISFEYKIPITTLTALYQLYANDLVVIAMTILNSKSIDIKFLDDCKKILKKINKKDVTLSETGEDFFNIINHCIHDNKIYISSDLW